MDFDASLTCTLIAFCDADRVMREAHTKPINAAMDLVQASGGLSPQTSAPITVAGRRTSRLRASWPHVPAARHRRQPDESRRLPFARLTHCRTGTER